MWTITLIRRILTGLWETSLTWDKKDQEDRAICRTPLHSVFSDAGLSEEILVAQVEHIVGTIEAKQQCNRLVCVEIKCGDPDSIIERLYETAVADDRIGYFIVVRDQISAT